MLKRDGLPVGTGALRKHSSDKRTSLGSTPRLTHLKLWLNRSSRRLEGLDEVDLELGLPESLNRL